LQQKSMGFVDVNAGLCSGSTEDSAYANKSELLNQPIRYIAARGEIGGKGREQARPNTTRIIVWNWITLTQTN